MAGRRRRILRPRAGQGVRGLGCQFRVELALDDAAMGVGVCVTEDVWRSLPDHGVVVMRGKRSELGIDLRAIQQKPMAR